MGPSQPHRTGSELESTVASLREDAAAARNLGIKTEHQLKSLAAEVRTLGSTVEKRGRWSLLNSSLIYLIFAGVAAGTGFLLLESQSENHRLTVAASKKKKKRPISEKLVN